jgi:hypothetical protein
VELPASTQPFTAVAQVKLTYFNTMSKKTEEIVSDLEIPRAESIGLIYSEVDTQRNRILATEALDKVKKILRIFCLHFRRMTLLERINWLKLISC